LSIVNAPKSVFEEPPAARGAITIAVRKVTPKRSPCDKPTSTHTRAAGR
jgi:hypothetical protein